MEIKPTKPSNKPAEALEVPVSKWLPPVLVGWLIPGGGHFFLRKHARGGLLALAVILMFLLGIMMRGATFQKPFLDMLDNQQQRLDLLTKVINTGGFLGNVATGLPYLMTSWLGYDQADVAGHVHDYGTKFLVAAGLLNILAMVDVFEIATRKKE